MSAPFRGAYQGRRVLITGHTGFKGAWLTEWLCQLGAKVTGFSLPPPTAPALFDQLHLGDRIQHIVGDIRDRHLVARVVHETRPHFLFHLAAQPLVRLSYAEPVETYETNVMGTINVLEALRTAPSLSTSAVFITTDKCYENREWIHSYREEDALGGHDPYSSSKAAAEIVIAAYRRSFFNSTNQPAIRVASARAGNVIGGGDWALDRIIPDAMRALSQGDPIPVRNKHATRPWQHVLEPLSGYLWLGAVLDQPQRAPEKPEAEFASAFNFGPPLPSNRTVGQLIAEILKHHPGEWLDRSDPDAVHEASLLNLATDRAHHLLQWRPVWDFEEAIEQTVYWYRDVSRGADPLELTRQQIKLYTEGASRRFLPWASPAAIP